MKRAISILLVMLMLGSAVSALAFESIPQISGGLFSGAKQAVVFLASGEYERLVTLLPFSGVAPSAVEWQGFAEGNFSTLGNGVQTEYAVAYWTGAVWTLAVPVSVPEHDGVEVLALFSTDGNTFSGYRYTTWGNVQREYQAAAYVTWDREYIGASSVTVIN